MRELLADTVNGIKGMVYRIPSPMILNNLVRISLCYMTIKGERNSTPLGKSLLRCSGVRTCDDEHTDSKPVGIQVTVIMELN